jgi:CheY-like chemotaxis protein
MKLGCILHVDDDQNDVLLMQIALEQAGVTNSIQSVNDGQTAIDYLDGKGQYADRTVFPLPAVVLLDLKMPRKGGLEVLQWIRAQPILKRTVVLILSASGHAIDVDAAYEHGANAYLVKPATLDERNRLIGAIKEFWLVWNTSPSREPSGPEIPGVGKL